jgi:hypothetical protein
LLGRIDLFPAILPSPHQEVVSLREEIRIKDVRMGHLHPQRRPHYPSTERMAILQLRALRGWSLEQTAKAFLVTADTISSWVQRIGVPILARPVRNVQTYRMVATGFQARECNELRLLEGKSAADVP